MSSKEYLDFDLLIERSGENAYRARVLSSPAGQAVVNFSLPFSQIEQENFLLRLSRPRRGVRRLESQEMETAKSFGGQLFKSVFSEELMSTLRSSMEEAQKHYQGLRIRLRLNDAPELVNLPWEYLYNPSLNRFLSLSIDTPLVRYMELPERIAPLSVSLPIRLLVMISSPTDYPKLDVEQEWNNLKAALCGLEERGLIQIERIETASPVELQYHLRRSDYHIFHFIGHGGFNEQAQDGILLFEDENKRGRQLSGQYLGTLLHDEKTLRLVILNACEGAVSGSDDPFAGVAQNLVQQGMPAVIAMQREITDEAAITFAREFYTAIAEGFPVDASMSEARKAIFSLGNDIEWGTPVLYMRAPDGKIFDVNKLEPARIEPEKDTFAKVDSLDDANETTIKKVWKDKEDTLDLESLYIDGLSAYWLKDWAHAWEHFRHVEEHDPDYKDLPAKLAEVKNHLTISTLHAEVDEAIKAKNWDTAIEALEKLNQLSPNDQTIAVRLTNTRQDAQLDKLYTQAQQLFKARQWEAVRNVFSQIHALQVDYLDPEDLLTSAENEIVKVEKKKKLIDLYSQGLSAIEEERWQDAVKAFQAVQEIEPVYRDTQKLLKNAQVRLEVKPAPVFEQPNAGIAIPIDIPAVETSQESVRADTTAEPEATERKPALLGKLRIRPWLFYAGGGLVLVLILAAVLFGGGSGENTADKRSGPQAAVVALQAGASLTPTDVAGTPKNLPTRTATPTVPTATLIKKPTATETPPSPTPTGSPNDSISPSNSLIGSGKTSNESSSANETYELIKDDSGSIQFEVPSAWSDINTQAWKGEILSIPVSSTAIQASTNLKNFWDGNNESGVFFTASKRLGEITGTSGLQDSFYIGCYRSGTYIDEPDIIRDYQDIVDRAQAMLTPILNPISGWKNYNRGWAYSNSTYEGTFNVYICKPDNSIVIILTTRPKSNPTAFLTELQICITKEADYEAFDRILNSLEINFDQ